MNGSRVRKITVSALWALAGVVLVVLMWELVKLLGSVVELPLKTDDTSMPHVWTMVSAFGDPEVRGSDTTVWQAVLGAAAYSLLIALGGFVIGVSVGLLLAITMQRFYFFERGLLPFVIASQTVPLIALAPLIVGLGNRLSFGPVSWTTTYSVMFIAAYLAFFPLSVGALRGLQAPKTTSLELMQTYAATPRQVLWKLRFPSSIPYLVPALKVSIAAAVVGTVVAEISTGVKGGIGRLIIEYARETTSQPAKVYVAVFGAIVLGLVATALVTALDLYLTRNLPKEGRA
ncbi:MAG: ABC transporter permease subunit [Candidatus Nanopelagicales bacterium]|nr:ABC transporter permease subunit [Candidatus Nanopelagicales bacterium]MCF8539133.1 ABC transporter permease subunit [Candidatus Nanopelagicales bacterium]MCF8550578.1 ABC transporter permease subunit [Candidatus Nanopelagicales bacterium]